MPLLPYQWGNSAAQATLASSAGIPEHYQELWWASGSAATTTGNGLLQRGSNSTANATATGTKLYVLSSSWPATTNFVLEASIKVSGGTATVALWDFGANAEMSSTLIQTTNSAYAVLRSSTFTLTPGNTYGVRITASPASTATAYVTDVSLICLM